jgi:hypothetical protein
VIENPGSGQSPRPRRRSASARPQDDDHGALDAVTTSSLTDVDAAIAALRATEPRPAGPQWLDRLEHRSPDPTVCPFLCSVAGDGSPARPIGAPDAANRCAALRDAAPQSLRQQELVCLTSGHVQCPRYLRGTMLAADEPRGPRRPSLGRGPLTPAILVSVLVLIAAFTGSVAFVVARGGMSMSAAVLDRPGPSATLVAGAPSREPTAVPTTVPTAKPSPTPAPTQAPSPTPTATPAPSQTPVPTPTPTPTPRVTPRPTAAGDPILARFPELRRCPNRSGCYIYVVEPGNNLYSIANYYRVSYDQVLRMNPQITSPATIRAGDQIRMPTPQRR